MTPPLRLTQPEGVHATSSVHQCDSVTTSRRLVAHAAATANGTLALQAESSSSPPVFAALRTFGSFLIGGLLLALFSGVVALWGAPASPLLELGHATAAVQQLGLSSVATYLTKQQALAVGAGIVMFISTALGPVLTLGDRNVRMTQPPSTSSTPPPPSRPTTTVISNANKATASNPAAVALTAAAEVAPTTLQDEPAPNFVRGGRIRTPLTATQPIASPAADVAAAAPVSSAVVDAVSRGSRSRMPVGAATAAGPTAAAAVPAATPDLLSGRGGRVRSGSPAPALASAPAARPAPVSSLSSVSRGGRGRSSSPSPALALSTKQLLETMSSPAQVFPDGAVLYSLDQLSASPPASVLARSTSPGTTIFTSAATASSDTSTSGSGAVEAGSSGGRLPSLFPSTATDGAPASEVAGRRPSGGSRRDGATSSYSGGSLPSLSLSSSPSSADQVLKEPVVAVAAVAWAAMDVTRDVLKFATTEAAPALQKLAVAGGGGSDAATAAAVPASAPAIVSAGCS